MVGAKRSFWIERSAWMAQSRAMKQRSLHSQFGDLTLTENEGAITALTWGWVDVQDASEVLEDACAQLGDYAQGRRETFDLPLRVEGSDFQRDVCAAMAAIPFGYTKTYGTGASSASSSNQFMIISIRVTSSGSRTDTWSS